MSGDRIEVTFYDPEHSRDLARLRQAMFGMDLSTTLRHLEWQYERNPYLHHAVALAWSDGVLVGARGLFGSRWEVGTGGPSVDIPSSSDTAIHPDHREGGVVYAALVEGMRAEMRRRDIRWFTNLSSTPANLLASRMGFGMRSIGNAVWLRRGQPMSDATQSLRDVTARLRDRGIDLRAARAAWAIANRTLDRLRHRTNSGTGDPVGGAARLADTPEIEEMAGVAAAHPTDRIRHVRDADYFDWRLQNPESTYRFLYTGEAGMDGYAILQNTPGHAIWRIADMAWTSDRALDRLASAFHDADAWPNIETWWSRERPELNERLIAAGLERLDPPRRHRTGWLIGDLAEDADDRWQIEGRPIDDPESWEITLLASDIP